MIEWAVLWEWLSFAVRWAHVVAAIGWIGTSFYFIALDLGLRKPPNLPTGVGGEEWQVHGGGFYHVQKYMVAPPSLPEHLTWFKWESYATWLTGFAMLCVVYYASAELYLIDRKVLDVEPSVAIAISIGSLAIGWLLYDGLCRSPIGKSDTGLMLVLYVLLVAMAWGYTQVFTGRAAFLHLGAFVATIMSANVFLTIIPNQKKVVTALLANKTPEAYLGAQAKQRSLHNNYLTLPVIFLMLSMHNPLAFASDLNWVIVALVFLIGVAIRHYFNTYHRSKRVLLWTWGVAILLLGVIAWISTIDLSRPADKTASFTVSSRHQRLAESVHFDAVEEIVTSHCSMCHAAEPLWDGIRVPPKNVVLEDTEQILHQAYEIYLQAGISKAMPPAGVVDLEPSDRKILIQWYRGADG
ncbi:MAG: urate hydroxylase PuuD [Hyphomicrobiaceae bacterium]